MRRSLKVAFDLVLRNARLANSDGSTVDIAVAEGRIAAIAPRIAADGESANAGGQFVSPALVECHFHLDKSRILDRCCAARGPPRNRLHGSAPPR